MHSSTKAVGMSAAYLAAIAAGVGAGLYFGIDPKPTVVHGNAPIQYVQIPDLITPEESEERIRMIVQEQTARRPSDTADDIELLKAGRRVTWLKTLEDPEHFLSRRGLPLTIGNVQYLQDVIDGLDASLTVHQERMVNTTTDYLLTKIDTGDYYVMAPGERKPPWHGTYSMVSNQYKGPLAGQRVYLECWPGESADVDAAYAELIQAWDTAYDEISLALNELTHNPR